MVWFYTIFSRINIFISLLPESNRRSLVYDTTALPTKLRRHIYNAIGDSPRPVGVRYHCSDPARIYNYGELSYPGSLLISIKVIWIVFNFERKIDIISCFISYHGMFIIRLYNQDISFFRMYFFAIYYSISIIIQ